MMIFVRRPRRASVLAACACAVLLAAAVPGEAAQTLVCTPSNNTINFGAYDVLGGSVLDTAGSFTVSCTDSNGPGRGTTLVYTAQLDVATARQMAPLSGTDRLLYDLYTDATRTQVWGDGTGGTFTFSGTLTVGKNQTVTSPSIPYYGRITPGGQDVSAASPGPPPTTYTQVLTITVTCVKTSAPAGAC